MNKIKNSNKTKLRQRILAAFSCVLFFSFMFTVVIFNIAIRIFAPADEYYHIQEQGFVGRAGFTLFVLVGIMFVVAVIVTYFLSNSITRPIEKLGEFALGIGKGNFDTNDFVFKDSELEDLNAALNKSVKQLGIYDSEQKIFFQNASHELRTPLMSIKCYAEGINFGIMNPDEASKTILEETDKLSELVADLLYISQVDNITAVYTAKELNLVEIIKGSAKRQQAMANKRQISFSFDFGESNISYKCDEELISRAIDNLISNAVRYAETEITLSCRIEQGNIIITVVDDGNGIEVDALPHIFERFYKGKGGNTGIGLAIVKSIVDLLGGNIKAENGVKNGARFTMSLPR
ncbi:MAG: HAMP domain-containing histidine kinase [Defluviitaleaceae bacterium]|nr:HAMP domain-containing histidine kinase [Defluviitaleaceae bacterium]